MGVANEGGQPDLRGGAMTGLHDMELHVPQGSQTPADGGGGRGGD